MKRKLMVLVYLLVLLPVYSDAFIQYDGPYEGRVIDADTKQPLEGVVVLGVWYKEHPTVAGAVSTYYDAMETATNKNGEFKIKGFGLKIMSNIYMNVLIFKAGYEYIGSYMWDSFKEDELLKAKIKWEGKKAIIPLKNLTMSERKKQGSPSDPPDEAPLEKVVLILKEIDKNDKELGLKTRGMWRGQRYE